MLTLGVVVFIRMLIYQLWGAISVYKLIRGTVDDADITINGMSIITVNENSVSNV